MASWNVVFLIQSIFTTFHMDIFNMSCGLFRSGIDKLSKSVKTNTRERRWMEKEMGIVGCEWVTLLSPTLPRGHWTNYCHYTLLEEKRWKRLEDTFLNPQPFVDSDYTSPIQRAYFSPFRTGFIRFRQRCLTFQSNKGIFKHHISPSHINPHKMMWLKWWWLPIEAPFLKRERGFVFEV